MHSVTEVLPELWKGRADLRETHREQPDQGEGTKLTTVGRHQKTLARLMSCAAVEKGATPRPKASLSLKCQHPAKA